MRGRDSYEISSRNSDRRGTQARHIIIITIIILVDAIVKVGDEENSREPSHN